MLPLFVRFDVCSWAHARLFRTASQLSTTVFSWVFRQVDLFFLRTKFFEKKEKHFSGKKNKNVWKHFFLEQVYGQQCCAYGCRRWNLLSIMCCEVHAACAHTQVGSYNMHTADASVELGQNATCDPEFGAIALKKHGFRQGKAWFLSHRPGERMSQFVELFSTDISCFRSNIRWPPHFIMAA